MGEGMSLQTDVLAITNDGRHMLHPQGLFRMTWDIVLALLFIYTLGTQPLRVGFYNDNFITDSEQIWSIMELVVDVWFLIDVGLNFRTGYWDEHTKLLIMNPQEVKRDYLRGWFCVDFISSVPFAVVLPDVHGCLGLGALRQEVKLLKLLRLARVLRSKTVDKLLTHFLIQPSVLRMFKFIVMFIMVLHVTACSYWYTAIEEGMGTTIWLPTEAQGYASLKDKYAVAFHWAICAINGNYLAPETAREHSFTSLVMTIGIVVFASIVGSASSLLANLNAAAVERRNRLDRINAFLQYRKVSGSLQHKIMDFYQYLWQAGRGAENEELFAELPPKLRLQLGLALKERFIESVPLFKKSSPEFVVALVQCLEPKLATPNEIMMEENTRGNCMFFVNRGSLMVYVGTGKGRVELSSLSMGSFFGEIALLDRYRMRSASVKATTFCDMQSLGKEDFDDFLGAFPFFRKSIVYAAESRYRASADITKLQSEGILANAVAAGGTTPPHPRRRPAPAPSLSTIEDTGEQNLTMSRAVSTVQHLLRVRQQYAPPTKDKTTFEQAAHLVEAAEKKYLMQSESINEDQDSNWWDDSEEKPNTPAAAAAAGSDDGGSSRNSGRGGGSSIGGGGFERKRPSLTFHGVPAEIVRGGSANSVVASSLGRGNSEDSLHDGFDALRKRPRATGSSSPKRTRSSKQGKTVVPIA